MRVLLFGPYPANGKPITGGVMAVVYALAQGLARHPQLQVAVASAQPAIPERTETDGRVTIYRRSIARLPRLRGHLLIRRKLRAVARQVQPDLIHAHGTGYYAAAALDSHFPAVLTAHGVVYEEARRSGTRHFKEQAAWTYDARMEHRVLKRAHQVIAISPYIRQAFSAYPHLHWTDIPNPVDDAFFQVQRQPQPGWLFTPARIIPRKGIDVLLRAFAAIAADFPQATLNIAGETTAMPSYLAACQALVQEAGLADRVHFWGSLDKSALQAAYGRAAGVVLPARQETAPVAIEEAMAAGCPVIATAVGGVPFMVQNEQTGLVSPPDDVAALAQALARLLGDPLQSERWGKAGREAAGAYRLDTVVTRTMALYEQLLSEVQQ